MSDSLRVPMSPITHANFNEVIRKHLGYDSIAALAEANPNQAFGLLFRFFEHQAAQAPEVQLDGKIVASTEMDGAAATQGLAVYSLRKLGLDPDTRPIDVSVTDLVSDETILAFKTVPPSLA